jgi:hypothetical protein
MVWGPAGLRAILPQPISQQMRPIHVHKISQVLSTWLGFALDCQSRSGSRDTGAGDFFAISPLTEAHFIGMVPLRFGWASKHGELIGFSSTRK